MQEHPQLKAAYIEGVRRYPIGSTGSGVICGYQGIHRQVERAFADALKVDACVLFSSGYVANLSVAMLLNALKTKIIIDKYVHASIYDGLHLSRVKFHRYPHLHIPSVKTYLSTLPGDKVIVTESVFSMGGQKTPFNIFADLQALYPFDLIVDEAHAFGIYGSEGLGALADRGLNILQVPLRIIPLGKAYAASGAIIAGNGKLIEALIQVARPYIYSTLISPAYAYGLLKTLDIIRQADERRNKLFELITYFRSKVKGSHLHWQDSSSPIQQLIVGCPFLTLSINDFLQSKQIICMPIRSPTVPKAMTGFRVVLNEKHTEKDIDRLFDALYMACG